MISHDNEEIVINELHTYFYEQDCNTKERVVFWIFDILLSIFIHFNVVSMHKYSHLERSFRLIFGACILRVRLETKFEHELYFGRSFDEFYSTINYFK